MLLAVNVTLKDPRLRKASQDDDLSKSICRSEV